MLGTLKTSNPTNKEREEYFYNYDGLLIHNLRVKRRDYDKVAKLELSLSQTCLISRVRIMINKGRKQQFQHSFNHKYCDKLNEISEVYD